MSADSPRYRELVELARICAYQARVTKDPVVAAELRGMAEEYQQRAAQLDGGRKPEIEEG